MIQRVLLPVLLAVNSSVFAQWTPPTNPDPSTILNEARSDTRAGRYSDALAKHLWFHRNALKFKSSLYGVRLSFALSDWIELGKRHPAALEALKATRDDTVARIRLGNATRDDFHDVSSINEGLKEEEKTTQLFVWLDENNPKLARDSYDIAERSLVRSRKYELCGKYIDSKKSGERIIADYRHRQRMASQSKYRDEHKEFSQRAFSNSAATLVALLTLNGRTVEAGEIASKLFSEWQDENFRKTLEKAKTGAVPEPWPTLGG